MSKGIFVDAYMRTNTFFDNEHIDKSSVIKTLSSLNMQKMDGVINNGVTFTMLYQPSCECCPANFEIKYIDKSNAEQTINSKGHSVIFFNDDKELSKNELIKIFSVKFSKIA